MQQRLIRVEARRLHRSGAGTQALLEMDGRLFRVKLRFGRSAMRSSRELAGAAPSFRFFRFEELQRADRLVNAVPLGAKLGNYLHQVHKNVDLFLEFRSPLLGLGPDSILLKTDSV